MTTLMEFNSFGIEVGKIELIMPIKNFNIFMKLINTIILVNKDGNYIIRSNNRNKDCCITTDFINFYEVDYNKLDKSGKLISNKFYSIYQEDVSQIILKDAITLESYEVDTDEQVSKFIDDYEYITHVCIITDVYNKIMYKFINIGGSGSDKYLFIKCSIKIED